MATHLTLAEREFMAEQRAAGHTNSSAKAPSSKQVFTPFTKFSQNNAIVHFKPDRPRTLFVQKWPALKDWICRFFSKNMRNLFPWLDSLMDTPLLMGCEIYVTCKFATTFLCCESLALSRDVSWCKSSPKLKSRNHARSVRPEANRPRRE
jgi:hypothetical protein